MILKFILVLKRYVEIVIIIGYSLAPKATFIQIYSLSPFVRHCVNSKRVSFVHSSKILQTCVFRLKYRQFSFAWVLVIQLYATAIQILNFFHSFREYFSTVNILKYWDIFGIIGKTSGTYIHLVNIIDL